MGIDRARAGGGGWGGGGGVDISCPVVFSKSGALGPLGDAFRTKS